MADYRQLIEETLGKRPSIGSTLLNRITRGIAGQGRDVYDDRANELASRLALAREIAQQTTDQQKQRLQAEADINASAHEKSIQSDIARNVNFLVQMGIHPDEAKKQVAAYYATPIAKAKEETARANFGTTKITSGDPTGEGRTESAARIAQNNLDAAQHNTAMQQEDLARRIQAALASTPIEARVKTEEAGKLQGLKNNLETLRLGSEALLPKHQNEMNDLDMMNSPEGRAARKTHYLNQSFLPIQPGGAAVNPITGVGFGVPTGDPFNIRGDVPQMKAFNVNPIPSTNSVANPGVGAKPTTNPNPGASLVLTPEALNAALERLRLQKAAGGRP
jgi:hypothetical protein